MANTTHLSLVKLSGTEKLKTYPSNQAGNMDKIDAAFGAGFGVGTNPSVNQSINNIADGLAIIANGSSHPAISSGQYVYVRNNGNLSEGLYVATSNIQANTAITGSNVTTDSSGGLNALDAKISTKIELSYGGLSFTNNVATLTLESGKICIIAFSSANTNYHALVLARIDSSTGNISLSEIYKGSALTFDVSDPNTLRITRNNAVGVQYFRLHLN